MVSGSRRMFSAFTRPAIGTPKCASKASGMVRRDQRDGVARLMPRAAAAPASRRQAFEGLGASCTAAFAIGDGEPVRINRRTRSRKPDRQSAALKFAAFLSRTHFVRVCRSHPCTLPEFPFLAPTPALSSGFASHLELG